MNHIPDNVTPLRAGRATGAATARAGTPAFTGTYTLLADISEFQPDIADAAYLAWSKAIVIRACYGDAHDDRAWYGGQRRALLHAGGARFLGIYQYLVASQDGAAQARAFHGLVGAVRPGEVLIADFEEGQHAMLTAWYNEMLALGYDRRYLWTYTGANFGQAAGALPVEWIAAYGQAEPTSPHTLWQFTDAFGVPGVGTCDCSVYHGSIDQLASLACQPAPEWTYGAPQNLQVRAGRHGFHASWGAPAGAPEPPACYLLYVYKGEPSRDTLAATYPRTERGTVTVPDPGGLEPSTGYTLHVVASGVSGAHVRPFAYASVRFTTARALL